MADDWSTIDGLNAILGRTPIHRFLGMTFTSLDREENMLTCSMKVSKNTLRSDEMSQAHGGAVATLIDSTTTFAVCNALGRGVPTVSLEVKYLRPASGPVLKAVAQVRKLGRTVTFVQCDVWSGEKLVATGQSVEATA